MPTTPTSSSFKDSSHLSSSSSPANRTRPPDAAAARDAQGHFTHAFRVAAVGYALSCGKTQRAAAIDMGISDKTLGGWVRDAQPDAHGVIDIQRFDELAQLRAQNRELLARNLRLTQERDFLKKAAAYFATPTHPIGASK